MIVYFSIYKSDYVTILLYKIYFLLECICNYSPTSIQLEVQFILNCQHLYWDCLLFEHMEKEIQ